MNSPGPVSYARPTGAIQWLVGGSFVALLALVVFAPRALQTGLDVLGFGVCNQILSHTFVIGGHPLPFSARCTGIYLGELVGFGLLAVLRPRASGLPTSGTLLMLGLLFLVMVADGVNSTLQGLPGGHGLWETTNLVRILTGVGAGLSVAGLLYPVANETLWRPDRQREERSLARPRELLGYAAVLAVPVGLALAADGSAGASPVYWGIALASTAGMLLTLTIVNLLLGSALARRSGWMESWSGAAPVLMIALAVAVLEVLLLGLGRSGLVGLLGAPLPPGMPAAPGLR